MVSHQCNVHAAWCFPPVPLSSPVSQATTFMLDAFVGPTHCTILTDTHDAPTLTWYFSPAPLFAAHLITLLPLPCSALFLDRVPGT
jgi:hypothetical protein